MGTIGRKADPGITPFTPLVTPSEIGHGTTRLDERCGQVHIQILADSKGCREPLSHSHPARSSGQEQDLVLGHYGSACTISANHYPFVALNTSDSHLPGALTLAAPFRGVHPVPTAEPGVDFQMTCLVTLEATDISSIKLPKDPLDVVVGVRAIEDKGREGLELLSESRCSMLGVRAVGAERSGNPAGYGVDPCGLPMDTPVYDFPLMRVMITRQNVREPKGQRDLVSKSDPIDIEPFISTRF